MKFLLKPRTLDMWTKASRTSGTSRCLYWLVCMSLVVQGSHAPGKTWKPGKWKNKFLGLEKSWKKRKTGKCPGKSWKFLKNTHEFITEFFSWRDKWSCWLRQHFLLQIIVPKNLNLTLKCPGKVLKKCIMKKCGHPVVTFSVNFDLLVVGKFAKSM